MDSVNVGWRALERIAADAARAGDVLPIVREDADATRSARKRAKRRARALVRVDADAARGIVVDAENALDRMAARLADRLDLAAAAPERWRNRTASRREAVEAGGAVLRNSTRVRRPTAVDLIGSDVGTALAGARRRAAADFPLKGRPESGLESEAERRARASFNAGQKAARRVRCEGYSRAALALVAHVAECRANAVSSLKFTRAAGFGIGVSEFARGAVVDDERRAARSRADWDAECQRVRRGIAEFGADGWIAEVAARRAARA